MGALALTLNNFPKPQIVFSGRQQPELVPRRASQQLSPVALDVLDFASTPPRAQQLSWSRGVVLLLTKSPSLLNRVVAC